MKVRNMRGTGDDDCSGGCESWLDHWEANAPKSIKGAIICAAPDCTENVEVGAHVKKLDEVNGQPYIVPFCRRHNSQLEDVEIGTSEFCVRAEAGPLCGSQ